MTFEIVIEFQRCIQYLLLKYFFLGSAKAKELVDSGITTNEDMKINKDTKTKRKKIGLKNLSENNDCVASNPPDSHLIAGNPNYDPDTVSQYLKKKVIFIYFCLRKRHFLTSK